MSDNVPAENQNNEILEELMLQPNVKGDVIIGHDGNMTSIPGCEVFAKFDDSKKLVIIMVRDPSNVNNAVQIVFKK